MITFLFLNLAIFLIIIFLLIILSMVWPPDSPWAPWWTTDKKNSRQAARLAEISSRDFIYELGSGDATFLITCAKELGIYGVGIEIDPVRFLLSKMAIRLNNVSDKIKIERNDFFKTDISKATVVFVYLVPKALEKLRPKFEKELKKGTKIISFRYKINMPLFKEDKVNKIYLYIR
jgi:hypothetical protein